MYNIGSRVVVVRNSRTTPLGTEGTIFWKKQYECKHGIFGYTRIGIKTDDNRRYFLPARNTRPVGGSA